MRAHLFLFATFCLLLTACPAALHGVGGGSITPTMTPQAVMVDRPCGPTPWDKTPSINPQGWRGVVQERAMVIIRKVSGAPTILKVATAEAMRL